MDDYNIVIDNVPSSEGKYRVSINSWGIGADFYTHDSARQAAVALSVALMMDSKRNNVTLTDNSDH